MKQKPSFSHEGFLADETVKGTQMENARHCWRAVW